MIPLYGVCPVCKYGRALRKDRTLRHHQRLVPAGYSIGQCKGSTEPALAVLPSRPESRLTKYLEEPLTNQDPGTPPPPIDVQVQARINEAAEAVHKMIETLTPAILQFVATIAPVLAQIGLAAERVAKDLDVMVQQTAAANRRDRVR